MGYRVEYESGYVRKQRDRHGGRLLGLTAAFLVLFLLLVNFCWPMGKETLSRLLWPGDPVATKQAAEVFAEELRCGEAFGEAAAAFCREILSDADLAG